MFEQNSFGYWLTLKRKALDLTRKGLAARVGCSPSTIRKIEAEERRPSVQIVERLAHIFNIPTDEKILFLRFARGDWNSAPSEANEKSPWRASAQSPRSKLPAMTTSLIGRSKQIADVHGYLVSRNIRLVTLAGPPGIGKTRLSIEVGREALSDFADGVFFVALAPLEDSKLVAPTIVKDLGLVEMKNQPPLKHIQDGIGDKQMLLVLDNVEHLIEDTAPLVSDILLACPRLKILTTSREALRVSGEWLYSIPPLDMLESVSSIDMEAITQFSALTLFAERARAVRSDFEIDADNLQAVATICARLDGLPLAIELIAARIRLISPQALLEHLDDQFALSTDGMRAVSARQKTVQSAIAWSYDLLSGEEKELFACLSVFAGGFTLEEAASIFSKISTTKTVADHIASLLDKSLIQRTYDFHGESRFNMLVTIQHFALDCLHETRQEATMRNWHLAYFLELAEQADKEIHGPKQVEWVDRLEGEFDNFRAALSWCVSTQETEASLRLLGALGWSWNVLGHHREAHNWFDQIRVLPGINAHPALYARLLNHIGFQNWLSGEDYEAQSVLNESEAIWLTLGVDGEQGMAETLRLMGLIALSSEEDSKTARSRFEQSLELYERHGDQWGMAANMFNLAWIGDQRNDESQALYLLEQSLGLFSQLDDVWGIGRVSHVFGNFFLKRGDYEKARGYFDQHLRSDESLHFKQGIMVALQSLGTLYHYQGNYDQAEEFYKQSLAMCYEYGLNDWGLSLYRLGLVALHRNNYSIARQHFNHNLARKIYDEKLSMCNLLIGLAAVCAGTNQAEPAAKLHGAVQSLLGISGYRIPRFDRAEFDRHIQIAREQLGEAKFEALASEGRAITMEQAIEYALEI